MPATRALLTATAIAVLVSGCAHGEADEPNDADVAYAGGLVSHHAQTLQLLDLTIGRSRLGDEVGRLADGTRDQRFDEAGTARSWLEKWGRPVPRTALEHSHDPDSITYDTTVPGVVSREDLRTLDAMRGERFTKAWLRTLIDHERGAVRLAAEAAAKGQDPEVVEFAERDRDAHEEQVSRLQRLLGP
jgi:uncharacterized protein (DUF305 family)